MPLSPFDEQFNVFDQHFGGVTSPRLPAVAPPLTPDEQESLLSRIGSTAMHGLGYIGSSLGKGGRAVRGLIGGRPEELLNLIPFSDAMGITDPANEVTGASLLGNKDASFFSPEGIGGLGVDILTDPLTYLSFGSHALTGLGAQAAKAGIKLPKGGSALAKGFAAASPEAEALARATQLAPGALGPMSERAVAQVAGQSLGGHVGLGLPFMGNSSTFDLSRPAAAAVGAARAIPGAGVAEKYLVNPLIEATKPIRRGFSALFEKGTKGQVGEFEQGLARAVSEGEPAAQEAARKAITPFTEEVQRLAGWTPESRWTPEIQARASEIQRQLRTALELTGTDTPNVSNLLSQGAGQGNLLGIAGQQAAPAASRLSTFSPEIQDMAKRLRGVLDDVFGREQAAGIIGNRLERVGELAAEYAPRKSVEYAKGAAGGGISPGRQAGRLHDLFGGMLTEDINALSTDAMKGMSPLQKNDYILNKHLHYGPNEQKQFDAITKQVQAAVANGTISPDQLAQFNKTKDILEGLKSQAKNLAEYHSGLDVGSLSKVGGLFGNDLIPDIVSRLSSGELRINQANQALPRLAGIAKEGVPGTSLRSLLEEMGIDATGPRAKQILADQGIDLSKVALDSLNVPEDVAKNILGMVTRGNAPAGAQPLLGAYDSFLNLLKAGQTSWPGTWGRNNLSDIAQRWFHGGEAVRPLGWAKQLSEGGIIPGIAEKLPQLGAATDAEASAQLSRLFYQKGLADTRKFQTLEAAGINPGQEIPQRLMAPIGATQPGLGEKLLESLPGRGGSLNPLDVRGVGGREASGFTPVKAAQSASAYSENLQRTATFIDALRQGMSPDAAMQAVTRAHFDFSNLSGFERDAMRRIVPFYNWSRQSLPASASEILQNPGGRTATTMKALNEASGQQGFLPDYMTQTGYAVPTGDANEQGKRTYLTSLGLPFEDLAQASSLRGLVGQLAPFPRLPFELAMGQQAFSGRDMPNNYPMPGSPTLNMIAMNTPISRLLSTYRNVQGATENGAAIPAAIQALAGPRLTTVDPSAARTSAVRDFAEEQLRSNPAVRNFERMYVPRDRATELSPQEMMLLRLLATRRSQMQR